MQPNIAMISNRGIKPYGAYSEPLRRQSKLLYSRNSFEEKRQEKQRRQAKIRKAEILVGTLKT